MVSSISAIAICNYMYMYMMYTHPVPLYYMYMYCHQQPQDSLKDSIQLSVGSLILNIPSIAIYVL